MYNELDAAIRDCLAETHPRIGVDFWREFAETPIDELFIYHFGFELYLRNNMLTQESYLHKQYTQERITHKDDMSALDVATLARSSERVASIMLGNYCVMCYTVSVPYISILTRWNGHDMLNLYNLTKR